jgi:hypothetical protein
VTQTNFDVLVARLRDAGARLRDAASALNDERAAVFARTAIELQEQERLHTTAAAIPRDVVAIDDLLLFGYNVPTSLASRRSLDDVLALSRISKVGERDWSFTPVGADDAAWFLSDAGFRRDLGEITTYYADARLVGLQVRGDQLLMVFAVGSAVTDVRVLRWRLDPANPEALPQYVDGFGDDVPRSAEQFDFPWTEIGRDAIEDGRMPRIGVAATLWLTLDRGHLTFRIDDAVVGGRVVLTEPIAEPGQEIGELRVAYAALGDLLLLRVLPYREDVERFYVYSRVTRTLHRIDAVGRNCQQLSEGQGIVFPGGFVLANGESKVFAGIDAADYDLHAVHRSPNGEDVAYVYHRTDTGEYLLAAYSVVDRQMASPLVGLGYAVFPDGTLVVLRDSAEPQRVHTVGVYASPFCSPDRYQPPVASNSFHGRIGNAELVRVLGECFALAGDATGAAASGEGSAAGLNAAAYEGLVARTTRLADAHPWLAAPEAHGIDSVLVDVRRAAGGVLDELASVAGAQRDAITRTATMETEVAGYLAEAGVEIRTTETYIDTMAAGRVLLGRLSELAEVRFVDAAVVAALTERTQTVFDGLGQRAVSFLAAPESLASVDTELVEIERAGSAAATAAAVDSLTERIDGVGDELVMLTDVVGGVEGADPTTRTAVLARLSDALARRNGVRAALSTHRERLRQTEDAAAFAAAMAVLAQRASAELLAAASAETVDTALATLLSELETVEIRFGDVAEFAEGVHARRDELVASFGQRREQLAAQRTAHVERIVASAERVLASVVQRASTLESRADVDGFFATDPLVSRVRRAGDELKGLGEAGRAENLLTAINAARETARRASLDRSELFADGTVRIGRWKFGVNTEPFELRLSGSANGSTGNGLALRLTGTELSIPVSDERLGDLADLVDRVFPVETPELPRALFLAFEALRTGVGARGVAALATARVTDGYELGVHDVDAQVIATALAPVWQTPGMWIAGSVRAVAGTWLAEHRTTSVDTDLAAIRALGHGRSHEAFCAAHGETITAIAHEAGLTVEVDVVVDFLAGYVDRLTVTKPAREFAGQFTSWAAEQRIDLAAASFGSLVRWVGDRFAAEPVDVVAETAWAVRQPQLPAVAVASVVEVTGLRSEHPLIRAGTLTVDIGRQVDAYEHHRDTGMARFAAFAERRDAELVRWRSELGVDRLRPRTLSSFVRNRLVDDVLLPLVGDNVARQLGMAGSPQGLLLLISPPGYGKTTLVEYVADLLGFAMVKVNGPALGHDVTSLDPATAPDAASAEELRNLNRAFAMGTNTICYLDDIQHLSPALLSRFIPLADATRRIEGVIDGEARTFDLSGKRFVVVMAGNPYTSTGSRFEIPDMLANRASVHNLGDLVGTASEAFAESYIENACAVNDVLSPVIARGRQELAVLMEAAAGAPLQPDRLSHGYGQAELSQITSVLRHLARVRDALLKVNRAYIDSAAVDDALRGEPPFLLQGSYRNMARLAQRIVPAMTDAEVDQLLGEHYRAESQTLATEAGWNLAKLAEVLGTASPDQLAHVAELRRRWAQANAGSDPMARIALALERLIATSADGDELPPPPPA